ncbi:MAG: hypothetical protein ABI681_02110 [Gemmatimonadales bacterium]
MTDDTIDEESLRELHARTARLPREIAPPADAWARIKAEIERPDVQRSGAGRQPNATRLWYRPAFLVAAGLVLAAASSLATLMVVRNRSASAVADVTTTPAAGQRRTDVSSSPGTPATLAEFTAVENDYIGTANRLSAILESEETQLSPETVAKLRESLRVIDAAILEARGALAADPANKALIEMLSNSYNQKVDLLRRTTEMGRS